MDLQDFNGEMLYFDQPEPAQVTALLQDAAQRYATGGAEALLRQAYALAPANLVVLVGLYRFYYYQHRYADALQIAFEAMAAVAPQIDFPGHWSEVTPVTLGNGVMRGMGLVRFYLLALKGAGYLNLRLGRFEEGLRMLRKVHELDAADRLGVKVLLDVLAANNAEVIPFAARRQAEVQL